MKKKRYAKELAELEFELAKLQETVARKELKVAVIFEGRDAAGKGGAIKTIMRRMNPRIWRIWYNRAVVEPVMGFCTQSEYNLFMREAPQFERMLIESGVILLKFWIHVSQEEQEQRFQDRARDPRKRWKLSPIDLRGRELWIESSQYRDRMFALTSTDEAPWLVVDGNDKKKARLNIIRAILDRVPYEFNKDAFDPIELPPRARIEDTDYKEPKLEQLNLVKDYYAD